MQEAEHDAIAILPADSKGKKAVRSGNRKVPVEQDGKGTSAGDGGELGLEMVSLVTKDAKGTQKAGDTADRPGQEVRDARDEGGEGTPVEEERASNPKGKGVAGMVKAGDMAYKPGREANESHDEEQVQIVFEEQREVNAERKQSGGKANAKDVNKSSEGASEGHAGHIKDYDLSVAGKATDGGLDKEEKVNLEGGDIGIGQESGASDPPSWPLNLDLHEVGPKEEKMIGEVVAWLDEQIQIQTGAMARLTMELADISAQPATALHEIAAQRNSTNVTASQQAKARDKLNAHSASRQKISWGIQALRDFNNVAQAIRSLMGEVERLHVKAMESSYAVENATDALASLRKEFPKTTSSPHYRSPTPGPSPPLSNANDGQPLAPKRPRSSSITSPGVPDSKKPKVRFLQPL